MKAIETLYKGYRFRSRLEARWAVFFDALGVRWEYERQGYSLPAGAYLPDFWLPIPGHKFAGAGYWVEVKPTPPTEDEKNLLIELAIHTGHNAFLLAGNVGEFQAYKAVCVRTASLEYWAARPSAIALTARKELRHNDAGDLHPDDYFGVLLERDDPQAFGLPFCELNTLTPEAAGPDEYRRAYAAARSARFEHGETPWTRRAT